MCSGAGVEEGLGEKEDAYQRSLHAGLAWFLEDFNSDCKSIRKPLKKGNHLI